MADTLMNDILMNDILNCYYNCLFMTDKIKAASISLALITLITGLKFFLYYISNSITVLSEAWHSFSDIATTALVLISILRQHYKAPSQKIQAKNKEKPVPQSLSPQKILNRIARGDTELKIAFIISFVLLSISFMILWKAIFSPIAVIEKPLITGVTFIFLSFGSFFLYRFQDSMGKEDNSAALKADSLHNRADMIISLFAGASLILYHFGFNIDRWVSVYIAIFIFSFAFEMLINVIVSMVRRGNGLVSEYSFSDICRTLFSSGFWTKFANALLPHLPWLQDRQEAFNRFKGYLPTLRRQAIFFLLFIVFISCVKTMVYTVNIDEQALVLRFGQILVQDRVTGSGMHFKLPWPIDRIERFQTGKVFSLAVGNMTNFNKSMIWRSDHGDTETFICGDNNLFLPYLSIHYRIKAPKAYYLNFCTGSADKMLEYQSYHILSQTFAHMAYFDIALKKRKFWTQKAEKQLQKRLDQMKTGIEIVAFCLRDIHPPKDIAASYDNVVAAYQTREQSLNQAQQYYSTTLPNARAQANQLTNEVQAQQISQLNIAQGEAQSFKMLQKNFKAEKDLTKDLLSLEAAQKTLKGKKIVLIDSSSKIDPQMIYFETHMVKEK